MKNSLDYLKEACPEHWAEISKYPVDKMLRLMDVAIKESYNQAIDDIFNMSFVFTAARNYNFYKRAIGFIFEQIAKLKKQ